MSLDDYDHTVELLTAMLKGLDEKTVSFFSDFRSS
jgi:hypothetical protein